MPVATVTTSAGEYKAGGDGKTQRRSEGQMLAKLSPVVHLPTSRIV